MKALKQMKAKIFAVTTMAVLSIEARADNQLQLTNIQGSTGAGSNDITNLMTKGQNVAQAAVNFALIAFGALGVILIGLSLWALYKAQKDQRDSPKAAVWGLIIGALLTSVALVVGLLRNTVNVA
ncbi:hypothetical protein [Burkholderia pseudomallei]|uniref:hypothetical protein n=1 Tax=Burkholderia pseudomallei TaxID=28450 RepID=UPI000A1A156F|nr:hypothetical protein [Burkholderia pseudomallei]ARL04324.1 hypothetical protein BOC44_21395 [Burkholderia pseudomallei]